MWKNVKQRLQAFKEKDGFRIKALKALGKFLALLLVCTFLSRMVYASSLPVVETQPRRTTPIEHWVKADGSVEASDVRSEHVPAGIRIERILVREGQLIASGAPILQLDTEDLTEWIEKQKLAIEKIKVQMEALKKNQKLDQQEKSRAIERAEEDLEQARQSGGNQVQEADDRLAEAQDALDRLPSKEDYMAEALAGDEQLQALRDKVESLNNELEQLKQQAGQPGRSAGQSDLQQPVPDIGSLINQKEEECKAAKEEYSRQYEALAAQKEQEWEQQRQERSEQVENLEKQCREARKSRDDSVKAAERNKQDASAPMRADSTLASVELELEQQQDVLDQYLELFEQDGWINSRSDGFITKLSAVCGERTPDGAILLLADVSGNLLFQAFVDKEQRKYLEVGQEVTVKINGVESGGQITAIQENPEQKGSYLVSTDISKSGGEMTPGSTGSMETVQRTGTYHTCIPVNALYEEGNTKFVYLLETQKTILGEELTAVRRDVTVLDKNEKFAALEENSLSDEDQVIVSADRYLSGGAKVRLQSP